MEDTKKTDESTKPEELTERVELTDEQLDQASGGSAVCVFVAEVPLSKTTLQEDKEIHTFFKAN